MPSSLPYQKDNFQGLIHLYANTAKSVSIGPFYNHTFIVVKEGTASFAVGKDKFRIAMGDCLCLLRNPETSLTLYPNRETGKINVLMLEFPRMYLVEYFRTIKPTNRNRVARTSKRKVVQMPNTERLKAFCNIGWDLVAQEGDPSLESINELRRSIVERVLTIDPFMHAHFFDFHPLYRIPIREFLERYYHLRLSVDEMAIYSSRSKAAFKRDVVAEMGLSPERAIMNLRINRAHELLAAGKKPTDVSRSLGFISYQHFVSRYKKAYGYTPSQTEISE